MRAARQTPMYNPVSHLVYVTRGDDVRNTIVNGKILMRDRQLKTLDREAVIADANRLAPGQGRVARMRSVQSRIRLIESFDAEI